MPNEKLNALTIEDLATRLRRKEVSPRDVVESSLGRIKKLNPMVNAFTTVCDAEARRAAEVAEDEILRGQYRGPLHGVPIGVKDLYDTAGTRTTYGSGMFRDHVPQSDAHIVTRLRKAGAVIVGKTATHELGLGLTTNNFFFGATRNPWNLDHVPGGSSGGSGAAIAADMCTAATGSDGGGSIRFPSLWCGCVGVKPTVGLVSNRGELGHPGSSFAVAGPICKTVRDAAILLQVMAGYDAQDPWSVKRLIPDYLQAMQGGVGALRIGVSPDFFRVPVDLEVRESFDATLVALEALGAEIVEVAMPNHERAVATLFLIMGGELAPWYRKLEVEGRAEYGPETRPLVELALGFAVDDYMRGRVDRRLIARDYEHAFTRVDVIVSPVAPITAPKIGQDTVELGGGEELISQLCASFTAPANMSGLPAVAIPVGLSRQGLPLGVQVIAPHFEEARAMRVANAYVEAAPAVRRLRAPLAAR